jgi:hypothetical protein
VQVPSHRRNLTKRKASCLGRYKTQRVARMWNDQ